jgi:hypothetical protein
VISLPRENRRESRYKGAGSFECLTLHLNRIAGILAFSKNQRRFIKFIPSSVSLSISLT